MKNNSEIIHITFHKTFTISLVECISVFQDDLICTSRVKRRIHTGMGAKECETARKRRGRARAGAQR